MKGKALVQGVFHGCVASVYLYSIFGFWNLPPMPHRESHEHFAGSLKYLTYWNLVAQFLYFALSFIVDFIRVSSSKYQRLLRFRDKMFAGIAFPYGLFVFFAFWSLYLIDRELIFPKVLDKVFPIWLNHVAHTLIVPALLIETYLVRHRHPRRRDGFTVTAVFGLIYIVWVLYLGLGKDIWPYPVLRILNWGQRGLFFGAGILLIAILYFVGEKINTICWGNGIVSKSK